MPNNGVKFSQFPGVSTINNSDQIVGLHEGANARWSFSTVLAWFQSAVSGLFVPSSRKINNKALSADITLDASDVGARPSGWTPSAADVGAAPTNHASSGTDYGIGSDANYGHVRLSNQTNQQSGVTGGIAATPMAVKAAYDLAAGKADPGDIPSPYTSNPAMDGTASPGSSTAWARGDHVHPSDTSKQDVLIFDNQPAMFSNNPVKSSGIYLAIQTVNSIMQGQLAPAEYGDNTANAYASGDYFYWSKYDMLLRATTDMASGTPIDVGVNCEEVQIGNELNKKPGYEMLAPLETSTTASRAYSYGERFVYGGVLYQAISPIAVGGTIAPGTNCQDATSLESRFKTYNYTANGTYTVTLARNSRRYLVIADRLGRAAALVNYVAYNGNTPQMVTIADIDSANRGISLSISGATLTITVSATYAIVKIMEV